MDLQSLVSCGFPPCTFSVIPVFLLSSCCSLSIPCAEPVLPAACTLPWYGGRCWTESHEKRLFSEKNQKENKKGNRWICMTGRKGSPSTSVHSNKGDIPGFNQEFSTRSGSVPFKRWPGALQAANPERASSPAGNVLLQDQGMEKTASHRMSNLWRWRRMVQTTENPRAVLAVCKNLLQQESQYLWCWWSLWLYQRLTNW